MSELELDEIRAAADRSHTTVSEWVRNVLREARERQRTGREAVAREARSEYGADEATAIDRVRVELELRPSLIDQVQSRYHLPSRRAAVEFALRRASIRAMSREEVLEMEGAGWDGDLDESRSGDPGGLW